MDFNWPDTLKKGKDGYPYWHQSSRDFGRIAYDDYSEDEEFEIDSGQQLVRLGLTMCLCLFGYQYFILHLSPE